MAVFRVSPILKRLTFVNWDIKKGDQFRIDKNGIFFRREPVGRVRLDERRSGSIRRRS